MQAGATHLLRCLIDAVHMSASQAAAAQLFAELLPAQLAYLAAQQSEHCPLVAKALTCTVAGCASDGCCHRAAALACSASGSGARCHRGDW